MSCNNRPTKSASQDSIPPSVRSYNVTASATRPLDGKSAGFEKEHTRSNQDIVGKDTSMSLKIRARDFIVGEGLLALMAQARAASLSIHAMTRRWQRSFLKHHLTTTNAQSDLITSFFQPMRHQGVRNRHCISFAKLTINDNSTSRCLLLFSGSVRENYHWIHGPVYIMFSRWKGGYHGLCISTQ